MPLGLAWPVSFLGLTGRIVRVKFRSDHEGFSFDEGFSFNQRKILRDQGRCQGTGRTFRAFQAGDHSVAAGYRLSRFPSSPSHHLRGIGRGRCGCGPVMPGVPGRPDPLGCPERAPKKGFPPHRDQLAVQKHGNATGAISRRFQKGDGRRESPLSASRRIPIWLGAKRGMPGPITPPGRDTAASRRAYGDGERRHPGPVGHL